LSQPANNSDSSDKPRTARVLANFGEALAIVLDQPVNSSRQDHPDDRDSKPADTQVANPDVADESTAPGEVRRAVPLKRLPLLVAGDRVECEEGVDSTMRATRLIDRSSELSRPDRRGHSPSWSSFVHPARARMLC